MGFLGLKQTPQHIAKRVEAVRKTKEAWSDERYRLYCERLSVSHKGYKATDEHKAKQSRSMKGKRNSLGTKRSLEFRLHLSKYWKDNPNHNHWVDGKGQERSARKSKEISRLEYRLWRTAVFTRDLFTCITCGQHGGKLEAHHVKSWTKFPELRFDVSNGEALCITCHGRTDNFRGRNRVQNTKAEQS